MGVLLGATGGLVESSRAQTPRFACNAPDRVVLQHNKLALYFRRLDYPEDRWACVRGARFAVGLGTPSTGPRVAGTLDTHLVGSLISTRLVHEGCSTGQCFGPVAVVVDLRIDHTLYDAEGTGRWFAGAVKVRASTGRVIAVIVRETPATGDDVGYDPGPGPFRIDVVDARGRRTVGSGAGIDPAFLQVSNRRVIWKQNGKLVRAVVTGRGGA